MDNLENLFTTFTVTPERNPILNADEIPHYFRIAIIKRGHILL